MHPGRSVSARARPARVASSRDRNVAPRRWADPECRKNCHWAAIQQGWARHAWLQLAYAYYWSDRLVPIALPKMIDLSQRLGETVNLAEASGDHIIYVSRLPCQHTYFAASVVGRRIPALSTSSGLAMLSTCDVDTSAEAVVTWPLTRFTPRTIMERSLISEQVEQARQEGFSIAREQVILNEIGIAAPIRSPGGEPSRAAIQCSVSASRWTEEGLRERIVPALLDTANAISPDPRS